MRCVSCLLALLLLVATASGWAVDPPQELECGEPGGGGEPALQGVVNAYLVYVSYPGDTDSMVGVSADNSVNVLTNWLIFASNGKQRLEAPSRLRSRVDEIRLPDRCSDTIRTDHPR